MTCDAGSKVGFKWRPAGDGMFLITKRMDDIAESLKCSHFYLTPFDRILKNYQT